MHENRYLFQFVTENKEVLSNLETMKSDNMKHNNNSTTSQQHLNNLHETWSTSGHGKTYVEDIPDHRKHDQQLNNKSSTTWKVSWNFDVQKSAMA